MRIALLTDFYSASEPYNKHANVIFDIITSLGHTPEMFGTNNYNIDVQGCNYGPGLEGDGGILIPRISAYGDFSVKVLKLLENHGWASIDSSEFFWDASDKWVFFEKLQKENLPTIPSILVSCRQGEDPPVDFPRVVKARRSSSGRDVHLARNNEEYLYALKQIGQNGDNGAIVQPFVAMEGSETDLRVHVVGNESYLILERCAPKDSWKTNMAAGSSVSVYNGVLKNNACYLAEKVAKASGLYWCVVDLLVDKDGELIVCEINPSPGIAKTVEVLGEHTFHEIIKKVINHGEYLVNLRK